MHLHHIIRYYKAKLNLEVRLEKDRVYHRRHTCSEILIDRHRTKHGHGHIIIAIKQRQFLKHRRRLKPIVTVRPEE